MADGGRDAVLFLDKNRVFVDDGNGALRLDIPENVIRDIDMIDKSGFDSLVDTFIKTKKLGPARFWLILADGVCFSKDFTEADPAKLEAEIKDFLEAVPFDQIISKRYGAGQGVRLIASNLEYIEAIIEIFERNGFDVEGIIPAAIFPGGSTRKILDAEFARYILENKNLMRVGNMLTKAFVPATNAQETPEAPKKSKLLPYLLAGFGLLVAILVAVIFLRR